MADYFSSNIVSVYYLSSFLYDLSTDGISMRFFYTDSLRARMADQDRECFGLESPNVVRPYLALWQNHSPTPLYSLPEVARATNTANVMLKDEGRRLGMGSFKALGGAYAVMSIFRTMLESRLGREITIPELLSPPAAKLAANLTFCCATDGNHGKSVAAGARILGCRSVIFVHEGVTPERAEAIGADEIVRVPGNYDDSVAAAEKAASQRDWTLVSDTSWPGYETIPALVAQGYTILADEALQQFEHERVAPPTHVFLQAGVGGFASSISAYLLAALGNIKTIVVEPDRAACLYESAIAGKLTSVAAREPTIMAMLECYTPSLVAWRVLQETADAFMIISEDDARQAMKMLAFRGGHYPIISGESGAAGLAGLIAAASDPAAREKLKLDAGSRILLICTETATDRASYEEAVGLPPEKVIEPGITGRQP
ncbi:diaminopropionate ammonia-lyase [Mesorhizobium sp. M1A.T.Ca.IN.004.03.1.1]|uniref:diaminopropionate ammonia-lyase n=1 Tax=Mesorhizobium sp. M1A.T.Ca.IN.004.03.1.1 TaxID=2496795 RepID=UPI001FDEAA16|nr:diaminopropionate ammonia-lyase [Mesorhizobium sp. M1A.T.Ca.IN.004.03.1.1]